MTYTTDLAYDYNDSSNTTYPGTKCDGQVCSVNDSDGTCIATADDADCGTIDCDGENYYFTDGSASPTATNYCKYRDYADITSNRCEGLGDCKDANTADCTSYSDSTAATCDTCKYATGACSSCTNYTAGTDTGTCRECNGAGAEQAPSDDSACGTIDCSNRYAASNDYCYNKQDITTNRCEGIGNCKDANTADCDAQANDALQYTCTQCTQVNGCFSGTLGSCSYVTNGQKDTSSPNTCTATHYRCNGSGSCTAPLSAVDVSLTCDGHGSCASYCTSQGYEGCSARLCGADEDIQTEGRKPSLKMVYVVKEQS